MTPTTERGTEWLQRLETLWRPPRPAVMGILNCTPDSFADGGRYLDPEAAVRRGEELFAEGADIVDVGGESTRPGAEPVTADEESRRVIPVLRKLRQRHPLALLSVDTAKSEVAKVALDAGADLVNDVSAASDPGMLSVIADRGAGIILMHMRGSPRTMQQDTSYSDVLAEVAEYLRYRAAAAIEAGIRSDVVWLDPGIGFGKDDRANLALLAALPDLEALGHPVVVGPSRKSFIGRISGAGVEDRLAGTLAALTPALRCSRAIVRVHDVRSAVQYLQIAGAIRSAAR
jgi:dihydropteroate synthase